MSLPRRYTFLKIKKEDFIGDIVVKIESAYYDGDEATLSKEKTLAVFGPIATGMKFAAFNQQRKFQNQFQAMQALSFGQRFSPYPAVAPPPIDEIAKLKQQLHQSQMREKESQLREKDTRIQFLQYQMQQQAMLTQQCLDSLKFMQNQHRGETTSATKTITFTQTETTNVLNH